MISNSFDPSARQQRLACERTYLYQPDQKWTYSHHASITHFKGQYHAIWSNGECDEDAPRQRVLWATSPDFETWRTPIPLFDTRQGGTGPLVLTVAGFHIHDGVLVAYAGKYGYESHNLLMEGDEYRLKQGGAYHTETGLLAKTTGNGSDWTAAVDLNLPVVPNHPPEKTASGRLIISGNIAFPYTDDPTGLSGWTMTGIYPDGMTEIADDSAWHKQISRDFDWPTNLCEGSFFQTDDGVIHMLLRSSEQRLWVTESCDDGESWSQPEPTGFSNDKTKFHCGRLPDGRFYNICCPLPGGGRCPLVISLSEDGERFDRDFIIADDPYELRRPGKHKSGNFGYPHSMIHDGAVHVIFSRIKESIEVLRFPLDQLK
jgi:hypothetical protein